MGQKIHPLGFRVGVIRDWESRWFPGKESAANLKSDYQIRKFVRDNLKTAAISRIEIERANRVHVIVNTAKPGLVIGKKGAGIEELRRHLEKMTAGSMKISVREVKSPDLDAVLVGQNIAEAIERRVAFRRAMKQAVGRSMKAGALGIKVMLSGRLGGNEIARSERTFQGKVPLHTLRADVDYAHVEAHTPAGRIGVKVWVYRGDVLSKKESKVQAAAEPAGLI